MAKRRSTDFNPNSIENPIAQEIFKYTYLTQSYVIEKSSFYSEYEQFYTVREIDEALKWLCDQKLFLSYLDDYFVNFKEFNLNSSWKNEALKEGQKLKDRFIEVNKEKCKEIESFVTNKILINSKELLAEFSSFGKDKSATIIRLLTKEKRFNNVGEYIYNKNIYDTDINYKNKVDAKIKELNLPN